MPNTWVGFLSQCSSGPGGQARRDWILHGEVAHSVAIIHRLEFEGTIMILSHIWRLVQVLEMHHSRAHVSPTLSLLLSGGILQHRAAPGATIPPSALLPAASGQQHAVHRHVRLHPQLCSVRLQQSWSPQPRRHWRHGTRHPDCLINWLERLPHNLFGTVVTDPANLANPPQHQNFWNLHPRGEFYRLCANGCHRITWAHHLVVQRT